MSTAWAFGIPLLLERGFKRHTSLHPGTMFYDVGELPSVIHKFVDNPSLLNTYRSHQPLSTRMSQRRLELARALHVDIQGTEYSDTGQLL